MNVSGENEQTVINTIETLYKDLKKYFENQNINILPPMPCPIDKIKNKHRWRIIIKCKLTSRIIDTINFALSDERIKKCKDTSIVVDINPNTMN